MLLLLVTLIVLSATTGGVSICSFRSIAGARLGMQVQVLL